MTNDKMPDVIYLNEYDNPVIATTDKVFNTKYLRADSVHTYNPETHVVLPKEQTQMCYDEIEMWTSKAFAEGYELCPEQIYKVILSSKGR